jgi:hypothetical protein
MTGGHALQMQHGQCQQYASPTVARGTPGTVRDQGVRTETRRTPADQLLDYRARPLPGSFVIQYPPNPTTSMRRVPVKLKRARNLAPTDAPSASAIVNGCCGVARMSLEGRIAASRETSAVGGYPTPARAAKLTQNPSHPSQGQVSDNPSQLRSFTSTTLIFP